MASKKVICPYCQADAVFTDSAEVYGGRSYGMIWLCRPCKSWVGVHKGSNHALGRLANAELRIAKQLAHEYFDPLWKKKMARDGCSKTKARRAGYRWLSKQLGIPYKKTHIGMFDVADCRRVVNLCLPYHGIGKKNGTKNHQQNV